MKIRAFQNIAPCSLVVVNRRFRRSDVLGVSYTPPCCPYSKNVSPEHRVKPVPEKISMRNISQVMT
jgi:hypothetical protein